MVKKRRLESRNKFTPLTICLFIILVLYVLFLLGIFAWVFTTASKAYVDDYASYTEGVKSNIIGWPKKFELFNNIALINDGFADYTLIDMALNTILYALGCSLSKVVVTCIVAYLCARYENWFSKVIHSTVIISMIVPIVGSQAAEIKLAQELHLYNSMIGMWIMRANFLGLYFLVFYAVFMSMPKGYYEAARIDGANDMQVMVKVALPLAKLTFLSIFLILFIEYWNDYLIPNLYLPNYKTLSLALYHQAQSQELENTKIARVPYVMASVLCVTVPVIIIFAIFSKRLMGNMSVGGLKG